MSKTVPFDLKLAKAGKPVLMQEGFGVGDVHFVGMTASGTHAIVECNLDHPGPIDLRTVTTDCLSMKQPPPRQFWCQVYLHSDKTAIVTRPVQDIGQCEAMAKEGGTPYGEPFKVTVPGVPF